MASTVTTATMTVTVSEAITLNGKNQGSTNTAEAYFNSSPAQTGMFVLFEEILPFGRSFADGITIQ